MNYLKIIFINKGNIINTDKQFKTSYIDHLLRHIRINMFWLVVLPSVVSFSFGTEPVQARQFASVQCIVSSGDLPLTILWSFNGNLVLSSDSVSISKGGQRISTLAIESVSERHAGNYSCIARNEAGVDSHTAQLRVNGLSQL